MGKVDGIQGRIPFLIFMSNLQIFCERKGINQEMTDAFMAYVRSMNASKFMMKKDGDTVRMLVEKMDEDQVQEAWMNFVSDFSKLLPTSL